MLITKSLYQSYRTRDFQGSSNHRQRGPNRICQRPAHRSKYLAYHGHDEYRIELESIPGLAIFIDFRKACDCTVDWNFLFRVLEVFNFGPCIKKLIRTFYTDCSRCFINNGFASAEFFQTRKGCPSRLSALRFSLCSMRRSFSQCNQK